MRLYLDRPRRKTTKLSVTLAQKPHEPLALKLLELVCLLHPDRIRKELTETLDEHTLVLVSADHHRVEEELVVRDAYRLFRPVLAGDSAVFAQLSRTASLLRVKARKLTVAEH